MSDLETTMGTSPSGYPFDMTPRNQSWVGRPYIHAIGVGLLIATLAGLTSIIPAGDVSAHNVLHHLNFLPLMIAGMLFGWRGALIASFAAGAVNGPLIAHHWSEWPLDAKDQIVELSIFSAAGLIAGYLSDREAIHRRRLERTQEKLEQVYLELRENVSAMKKAERLTAVGQLAASLAHEIRNPLASISGAAGILKRGSAPSEYLDDSLDIIQKESKRLNKLLTSFLDFAKPRSPRMQRTGADELLLSVISLASHSAELKGVILAHHSATPEEIVCDPEQMKQVLLNLVINAIEASPAGAKIQLSTKVRGARFLIEVEDAGVGISEDNTPHIFEPFFTTKPNGTGLGLAISSMIVSQHGGVLSFSRNPNNGTTMHIELPASLETTNVQ